MSQFRALVADGRRSVKDDPKRWPLVVFSPGFASMAWYRFNRAGWVRFGERWTLMRMLVAPLVFLLRPFIAFEIAYRADVGPGFLVLHPDLGVVVNGYTTIGAHCTFAGGNAVGGRDVVIGDDVEFGVNAVILGPAKLGDGVIVGAGAVVTRDQLEPTTLVGVPARPLR